MAPLFGPSPADLDHLRSAVKSLGTASVPGLAAALSWREHKTEKLLAYELARPNTPLVYDPARRVVRWAVAASAPPPPLTMPPSVPRPSSAPPSAPPPVYTPTGLKTLCPHCRVSLQSTGSAGLVVCPQCGRLSSARGTTGAPAPITAPAPSLSPSSPTAHVVTGGDRRSQEMFAAWLTNQAIPCPKCRTPLRHRGVSEYSCPACGQQVRFPVSGGGAPPPPVPIPAQ